MKTVKPIKPMDMIVSTLAVLILCATLACGQADTASKGKVPYASDSTNLQDALNKVRSGDFGLVHVVMLAQAGKIEAIPDLEIQFERAPDALVKTGIASALVKLRDKNDKYWDYLQARASAVINSDAPAVVTFSADGEPVLSPAYAEWAKAHPLPHSTAWEQGMYLMPASVLQLAEADDPRAIPLLEQGLKSNNFNVQHSSALGLAELHETDAIPLIISACEKADPQVAETLAEPLVYFDDARAAAAFSKYLPADKASDLIAARKRGRQPFKHEPFE